MTASKKAKKKRGGQEKAEEIHCVGCGRFMGYGSVLDGVVEHYCGRCKTWTMVSSMEIEEGELDK